MINIKEFLLLWICNWAKLIDGIIGILTFSRFMPSLTLKAATTLARFRHNHGINRLERK